MSVSFLRSLLSGAAVAASLGVALLLLLFILHGTGDPTALDAYPTLVLGASVLVGLAAGLTAARHAPARGPALGAGLLAAALGQFVVLGLAFAGTSVVTFDDAVPALEPLAWSAFGEALLTLLPAGLVGLVAAPLAIAREDPDAPLRLEDLDAAYAHEAPADLDGAPDLDGPAAPDLDGHAHADADAHAGADADATVPAAQTRRLKCPECGTINEAVRGERVRCYHCGLAGRTPA